MLLSAVNISVYLSWIPGHCGIQANEEVDMLARTLANDIFKNRVFAPTTISLAAAVQMSAEIAKESWQRKWNHGFTGYYTRMLIPTVGVKLFLPSSRDIGISYCRMLLHDTMLMEDSFRTGTSDTPLCECGVECESVEHFLLCCAIHETARKEMITNIINTVWSSSKCKRRLNMLANLLAPHWDSQISKIQDKYIKLALFDFLTSVDRKL